MCRPIMCRQCVNDAAHYCGSPDLHEAVQCYFHCQLRCGYRTAPEAFMDTVKIYKELRPSTPDWLVPKKVAEILNPNLLL